MGQKSGPVKEPAEQVVKEIRRATRGQFSAEVSSAMHHIVNDRRQPGAIPALTMTHSSWVMPGDSHTKVAS